MKAIITVLLTLSISFGFSQQGKGHCGHCRQGHQHVRPIKFSGPHPNGKKILLVHNKAYRPIYRQSNQRGPGMKIYCKRNGVYFSKRNFCCNY